jgi:ArsR family transcriptional regulator, arsenate/arsenite/antimonite-responsive transcriptional repressor
MNFKAYEQKFNALADEKRLMIMDKLCREGKVCVGELCQELDMIQSKVSYHLKILLEARLIQKEDVGTWCYYTLNKEEINQLLSGKMCCVFKTCTCCS